MGMGMAMGMPPAYATPFMGGAMPMPGTVPGPMPGAMPGVMPGAMPGVMPGAMPGAMPGMMPAGFPFTPHVGAGAPPPPGAPPMQQSHSGGGRFPHPKEKQPWDELDKFIEGDDCELLDRVWFSRSRTDVIP